MAHIPAAERRPQLVQAAIELMTREGADAGSTRAIAAELGVAQATVHYTFGTKRDLYRAVIEQMTAELVEQVRLAVPVDRDFAESIRCMARALVQGLREQPGSYLLLTELTTYSMRNPDLRPVLVAHQHHLEETAACLLAEVAARTDRSLTVDPLSVVRFFLAGFDGMAQRHLVMGDDASNALDVDTSRLVTATLALAGAA